MISGDGGLAVHRVQDEIKATRNDVASGVRRKIGTTSLLSMAFTVSRVHASRVGCLDS
jgi:hypothetical protein